MKGDWSRFRAVLESASVPALATAAVLYLAFFMFHGFQIVDEGVALVDAWRIAEGQVPHRDFFEIIPPLSFLPTALLFKLFGPSLLISRGLTASYGLLLIYLTDLLVKKFTASLAARSMAIALLIPFGTAYWPIPSHHWVADLLCLGSALCLFEAAASARPMRWALAAGALAGGSLFSLQDQGAYYLAGATLLYLPSIARGLRRTVLLGWISGAVAVAASVGGWLLPTAGASALLDQWLSFPLEHYTGIAGNEAWGNSILKVLGELASFHGNSGGFVYHALHLTLVLALLLIPLCAVGALSWTMWRGGAAKRGPLMLVAALCLAFGGAALHRLSITNLVWALPPMLVAVSIPSGFQMYERSGWTGRICRWGAASLAGVALLFAALFVARAITAERWELSTPVGTLWAQDAVEVASLQGVVTVVDKILPKGAPLFCRTPVPLVNFLCLHANPTPYTLFAYPGYNTEAQAVEVQRCLERRPDAWVLDTGTNGGSTPLDQFLEREYEVAWDSGYARLLRRCGEAPPQPRSGQAKVR